MPCKRPCPYHDKVRNLSRSLLVERLGGLAVSGELNVPALPSLAIVQVFYDKSFLCFGNLSGFYGQFFLAIIQVFIDKIFLAIFQVFSTKSFCQSFIFLTTNPTTYLVPQGLAERSGLKGEVLARAAPSSTSQVESKTTTTTSQVVPNTITTTSQVVPKPLGIHHYNNNKKSNSKTTNVTTQYKVHVSIRWRHFLLDATRAVSD